MGSSRPKGYHVPGRDPARAGRYAIAARRRRPEVLNELRDGRITVATLRELAHAEKALRGIRVRQLFNAIRPRSRRTDCERECRELQITPDHRIGNLGPA